MIKYAERMCTLSHLCHKLGKVKIFKLSGYKICRYTAHIGIQNIATVVLCHKVDQRNVGNCRTRFNENVALELRTIAIGD